MFELSASNWSPVPSKQTINVRCECSGGMTSGKSRGSMVLSRRMARGFSLSRELGSVVARRLSNPGKPSYSWRGEFTSNPPDTDTTVASVASRLCPFRIVGGILKKEKVMGIIQRLLYGFVQVSSLPSKPVNDLCQHIIMDYGRLVAIGVGMKRPFNRTFPSSSKYALYVICLWASMLSATLHWGKRNGGTGRF